MSTSTTLVLGFRPEAGVLGVLASLALLFVFCFAVSWVWTLFGLVVRTPQSLISLSMAVLFPLGFVSNIFVEPTTMPSWLEAFVDVNPISVVVTAVRGLMAGTATTGGAPDQRRGRRRLRLPDHAPLQRPPLSPDVPIIKPLGTC